MWGRKTTISRKTPNLTTFDGGNLRQISDTWGSYTRAKNTQFDIHLDLTRKSRWFIYLYFRICRMFWKKNERSGKHVQHLQIFLFFRLVHCSMHVIVTLQPFLNAPFPSNKPPPPPFVRHSWKYKKIPSDKTNAQLMASCWHGKEKDLKHKNKGTTRMGHSLLRISNKRTAFFLLDQLSITLICVPSYDLSYNVFPFPYWFVIGYFSVTTRI